MPSKGSRKKPWRCNPCLICLPLRLRSKKEKQSSVPDGINATRGNPLPTRTEPNNRQIGGVEASSLRGDSETEKVEERSEEKAEKQPIDDAQAGPVHEDLNSEKVDDQLVGDAEPRSSHIDPETPTTNGQLVGDSKSSCLSTGLKNNSEVLKELWDAALAELKDENKNPKIAGVIFEFLSKTSEDHGAIQPPVSVQDLVVNLRSIMEKEIEAHDDDGNNYHPLQSIISTLGDSTIMSDITIGIDPIHAALPWVAIQLVFLAITAKGDLRNLFLEGIAAATALFLQCSKYQGVYIINSSTIKSMPDQAVDNLKIAIIGTYVGSLQLLGHMVRWQRDAETTIRSPFQLIHAKPFLENMRDVGTRLAQAGDECESHCEFWDRKTTQSLFDQISRLHKIFKESCEIVRTIYAEDLLSKLPLAPGATWNHIDNHSNDFCHPETRLAVLDEIFHWARCSEGSRTFWLQGIAGTGKSTVARTIARKLETAVLSANFFFKRGEGDRGQGKRFFTTLAHQLACQSPTLNWHIYETIRDNPQVVHGSPEAQFEKLILGSLQHFKPEKGASLPLLIVDAFDECEDGEYKDSILRLLTTGNYRPFKVFIASRPEYNTQKHFNILKKIHHDFTLHQVNQDSIKHDIRAILDSDLSDFRASRSASHRKKSFNLPNEWPGNDITQTIVGECALFISVTTFSRIIRDENQLMSPNDRVRLFLDNSIDSTSDYGKLYYPILTQITRDTPVKSRNKAIQQFERIVGSIVLLAASLSATSLAKLLNIHESTINIHLDHLRSVFDTPKHGAPIRLFHSSFRDFLVHDEKAQEFHIRKERVHKELAVRCLDVLQTSLRTDICNMRVPGKGRAKLERGVVAKYLSPEVQYACQFWLHHMKASKQKFKDGSAVHKFLLEHFLHWLEASSLMGRMSDVVGMVNELHHVISTTGSPNLSAFVHDARRFALAFGDIIDESPLQAYSSALIFAPTESVIRKNFESHIPEWMTQLPLVESNWTPRMQVLPGGGGRPGSVAFLPNDWLVLDAFYDIPLWDLTSGVCIRRLTHESDYGVYSVTVSRDGRVASCHDDGSIGIWDPKSGICFATFPNVTRWESVYVLMAFLSDGNHLSLIERGGETRTLDLNTGQCVRALEIPQYVGVGAFSHNGHWLAIQGPKSLKLFRWGEDPDPVPRELAGNEDATVVAFSSNNKFLASASTSRIVVWEVATGQILHILEFPEQTVRSLALSRQRVVLGSDEGEITILDLSDNLTPRVLDADYARVDSLSFSADDTTLASLGHDELIKVWDLNATTIMGAAEIHKSMAHSVCFVMDYTVLLSADDHEIKLWDVSTGAFKKTLTVSRRIDAIVGSEKASIFAVEMNNEIQIMDANSLSCLRTIRAKFHHVWSLSLSANGKRLAVASEERFGQLESPAINCQLEIWDTASNNCVYTQRLDRTVDALALSHDGYQVAFSSHHSEVGIRNLQTGKYWMHDFRNAASIAFSPNGQQVIAINRDWSTAVWNTMSGKCTQQQPKSVHISKHDSKRSPLFEFIPMENISESHKHKDVIGEYMISSDGSWILRGGKRLLWLPPDYVACDAVIAGSRIAIGSDQGRVITLKLE